MRGGGATFGGFLATGPEGAEIRISYTAGKARAVQGSVKLVAFDPAEPAEK